MKRPADKKLFSPRNLPPCGPALLLASFLTLAAASLPGGTAEASPPFDDQEAVLADSSLYIVSTSSWRYRVEEGEEVILLDGDVRIDHQTSTITSDKGKHYRERKYLVLTGNVHGHDGTLDMYGDRGEYFGLTNTLVLEDNVRIVDRDMLITCDRGVYHRTSGIAVLTGRNVLMDNSRIMYADSIFYDRNTEIADACGNVVIIDNQEEYSISGQHARFFRETKEAVMDSLPVLVFDDRSEEKGRVKSRRMHFDMNTNVGTAVGSVQMVKGATRADCDSAVIYDDEGYMELYGNPVASSGASGMSGSRVVLFYDDRGVNRLILPAGGRLTESPAPASPWREKSWIEGDSMVINMYDNQVDSVRIFGNARAMYYPFEGDENKVSNNYSKGDSMFFRFLGEDLNYVRISGNATGVYNYLNLVPGQTIDSLAASIDSTLRHVNFGDRAEKVRYRAKMIEYFAATEDIVLTDESVLEYQDKALQAEKINFSSRLNVLEATGGPVLIENKQKMFGNSVGYDMDSEGGLVYQGSTKYDQGYYRGKHIFKDGEDVLKVYHSIYSTCDLKSPHYSMRAGRMKVYINDKIISGPITLYLGEIPVFYLPFMMNSLRRDRHSGILRPNFDIGINSRDGRFIRGLGYYWATNDYTDFTLTTDFNENDNFRLQVDNRYKVRYLLDGYVRFNYFRKFFTQTDEWTIKTHHSQQFSRTASFNCDLDFVSSDQAQSSMFGADQVKRSVDRRIHSAASFNKSWGGTRLGLSGVRDQKLNVDPEKSPTVARISTTMPNLSLSFPRTSLWFGEKHADSEKGIGERFLGGITFSPNLRARRTTSESDQRKTSKVTASSGMSFGQQHTLLFLNISPQLGTNWNYSDVLYDKINQKYIIPASAAVISGASVVIPDTFLVEAANSRLRLAVDGGGYVDYTVAPASYLTGYDLASALQDAIGSNLVTVRFADEGDGTGHFTFSSLLSGRGSSLQFEDPSFDSIYPLIGLTGGARVSGSDRSGPTEDTTYKNEISMSTSLGLGTTLYGTFYPRLGRLRGIRHTFNPHVSYSYRPAIMKNQKPSHGMSYSIRNVLDIKYLKGEAEEKKNGVVTWNVSGSYNPQGTRETRFSNISSRIQTALGKLGTFSINHTIEPLTRKIISTSFSTSFSVGGRMSYPAKWKTVERERILAARGEEASISTGGQGEDGEGTSVDDRMYDEAQAQPKSAAQTGRQVWSLRLGYSYSSSQSVYSRNVTNQLSIGGSVNLTKGWSITYSAGYDLYNSKFLNQTYSINRDLHCWEASFTHSKFGNEWSYYFQIRIRDLPDIMYERGKRGLRGRLSSAMDYLR
ncbi:MAG: hypothetical protein JXB45_06295 [Candidatus Krumholzibacteriota bacterium]|nr:hypothetical protein [Candidatus Krumholzibacteriota bacterium]